MSALSEEPEAVDGELVEDGAVDAEAAASAAQPGALTLLADARPLPPAPPGALGTLPAIQTVAAAATGFVAGAAALMVAQRLAGRWLARAQATAGLPAVAASRELGLRPVVSSRTYIVDVHVLAQRPSE